MLNAAMEMFVTMVSVFHQNRRLKERFLFQLQLVEEGLPLQQAISKQSQ
jgi:hypothetical protein